MKALQKLEQQLNTEYYQNFLIDYMAGGGLPEDMPHEDIRKLLEANDWHERNAINDYYSKM